MDSETMKLYPEIEVEEPEYKEYNPFEDSDPCDDDVEYIKYICETDIKNNRYDFDDY